MATVGIMTAPPIQLNTNTNLAQNVCVFGMLTLFSENQNVSGSFITAGNKSSSHKT